jgi:hypothetical protein
VCDTIEGLSWLTMIDSCPSRQNCFEINIWQSYSRIFARKRSISTGILKDFSYVCEIIARNLFVTKIEAYFEQNQTVANPRLINMVVNVVVMANICMSFKII